MKRKVKTVIFIVFLFQIISINAAELNYRAIKYLKLKTIKEILIDDPVLVNICDDLGRTPLHLASAEGRLPLVDFLIKKGAKVNIIDALNGYTPIHYACLHGYIHIARFLLARGALVNPLDKEKNTPLHFAAGNGDLDLCRLLILHGANIRALNLRGETPLFNSMLLGKNSCKFPYAQKKLRKYIELAKILSEPLWLLNLQNCDGVSPMDNLKKSGLNKRKVHKIIKEILKSK